MTTGVYFSISARCFDLFNDKLQARQGFTQLTLCSLQGLFDRITLRAFIAEYFDSDQACPLSHVWRINDHVFQSSTLMGVTWFNQ